MKETSTKFRPKSTILASLFVILDRMLHATVPFKDISVEAKNLRIAEGSNDDLFATPVNSCHRVIVVDRLNTVIKTLS